MVSPVSASTVAARTRTASRQTKRSRTKKRPAAPSRAGDGRVSAELAALGATAAARVDRAEITIRGAERSTLDAIEQKLRAELQGTELTVDVPELHPPGLPDVLWPSLGLRLVGALIERKDDRLIVTGSAGHALLGRAGVTLTLRDEGGSLGVDVDLDLKLPDEAPRVDLRRLVKALSLALPPLPPLALLDEPLSRAALYVRGDDVRISTAVDAGAAFEIRAVVARSGGTWSLVVGAHLSKDFRFAHLSPVLRPLDELRRWLRLGDPGLLVSTTESAAFPYRGPGGEWTTLAVRQGAALRGELVLEGPPFALVSAVLRTKSLPLRVPLTPDWSNVRIAASLDARLPLIPGCLAVESFQIALAAEPFAATVAGEVTIELFGAKLPRFVLGAALTAEATSLFFTTAEPWSRPLGLPIVIKKAGFQMNGPSPSYDVFGEVAIQKRALKIAARIVGQVPAVLAGKLDGELSFAGVLSDFTGVKLLPAFIDPKIRDVDVYFVMDPVGATIDGIKYPAGLLLAGTLQILGLGARAHVQVSVKRVILEGSLDKPVQIGQILRITGAKGAATPSLKIDTRSRQVGSMSASVTCLGITQAVDAVLGPAGFTFTLTQKVGIVRAGLNATLGDGGLVAGGTAGFRLNEKIGPIIVPGTKINLGTIHINEVITCELDVSATKSAPPTIKASAKVTFMGLTLSVPKLKLSITSLADLPQAILAAIRAGAVTLFASVLNNVGNWLKALAEGAIQLVGDVAQVLSKHFKRTSEQIARDLRAALKKTIELTAKALQGLGETPKRIGKILADMKESAADIGRALKSIGAAPKEIVSVLKDMGKGAAEIQKILLDLNVPANVIKGALGLVFNLIDDILPF